MFELMKLMSNSTMGQSDLVKQYESQININSKDRKKLALDSIKHSVELIAIQKLKLNAVELESDIERLKKQLHELKDVKSEKESLEKTHIELRSQIALSEEELSTALTQSSRHLERKKELEAKLKEEKGIIEELTLRQNETELLNNTLIENLREENETKSTNLKINIEELTHKLEDKTNRETELLNQITELNKLNLKEIGRLKIDKVNLTKQRRIKKKLTTQKRIKELQKLNNESEKRFKKAVQMQRAIAKKERNNTKKRYEEKEANNAEKAYKNSYPYKLNQISKKMKFASNQRNIAIKSSKAIERQLKGLEIEQKQSKDRLNSIYIRRKINKMKRIQTPEEYEKVTQKAKHNVRTNTARSINAQVRKFREDT